MVKKLLAMRETQVQFQGWEDSPEEEMATHSSILAWRMPWTEEPGRLQSMVTQMNIISTTVGKNPLEETEWPSSSTKESEM